MASFPVLIAVLAALYLAPTLTGWARHVPHLGSVAVVNILFGWTLIGWGIALAMAARSAPPADPRPPQWPPPPGPASR
ncbi:MAG: superinfection immunity protein [Streptosporangiaceae bacterium]